MRDAADQRRMQRTQCLLEAKRHDAVGAFVERKRIVAGIRDYAARQEVLVEEALHPVLGLVGLASQVLVSVFECGSAPLADVPQRKIELAAEIVDEEDAAAVGNLIEIGGFLGL